jgi:hypothetical protein
MFGRAARIVWHGVAQAYFLLVFFIALTKDFDLLATT